jgi:hypothetical protein
MNKIICDNKECEKEIILTKNSIESKFLRDGIQINFFRCRSCGDKYLIDVTDKETRSKQIEARKWAEQRNKALEINIDNLSEEELSKLTMLADECLFNIERLTNEIKEAKAELKVKYEGEL